MFEKGRLLKVFSNCCFAFLFLGFISAVCVQARGQEKETKEKADKKSEQNQSNPASQKAIIDNNDRTTPQESEQVKREEAEMSIIIDPRHPDWCHNQVNKDEAIQKGIKEFAYSNYVKDYSKSSLEKMFPVSNQWKEWYELEKQGKLPKNIKITDRNCWYIMHDISTNMDCLRNRNLDNMLELVGYKKMIREGRAKSRENLMTEIEKAGGIYPWYWKNKNNFLPEFFPIYLKTIEEWDKIDKWNLSLTGQAYTGLIEAIMQLHRHAIYFSSEMDDLKKTYISVFWDLYRNANNIYLNFDDQIYNKKGFLGLLNLLGEDFNKLTRENEKISDADHPSIPFSYTFENWDIVNGKVIEVIDLRLKTAILTELYAKKKSTWRNAILYFYDIGEIDEHIDAAVDYCYKYYPQDGYYILKLLTSIKYNARVKQLAEYYYQHIDDFTTDLDRKITIEFFKKEFGISGEKNEN